MPFAFEDLCDWAKPKIDLDAPKIISGGGKRTAYALLWSPRLFQDERAAEMHRVSFRLHGFIANLDIRPLGNWNKYVQTGTYILRLTDTSRTIGGVKGAVQYITLVGNEQAAAFDPQIQVIQNLDRYIYGELRGQNGLPPRKQTAINLRRRVFTKVRPSVYLNGCNSKMLGSYISSSYRSRRRPARCRSGGSARTSPRLEGCSPPLSRYAAFRRDCQTRYGACLQERGFRRSPRIRRHIGLQ